MTEIPVSTISDSPRLVMGMPRGGTTAMMRALNADPRVAAYGESLFWGRGWVAPDASGGLDEAGLERVASLLEKKALMPRGEPGGLSEDGRDIAAAAATAVRGLSPGVDPVTVFTSIGEAIARHSGRGIWVEKTPHHLQHLVRIFDAMPEARVLVMVREPEAFLRSYKHQGDRKAPEIRDRFHRLYHPMLASLVCRRTLQEAMRAVAGWPDSVMLVRLDEVRADPHGVMARIRRHLELPEFEDEHFERSNSSFEGAAEPPKPLGAAEIIWLRLLTGRISKAMGLPVPNRRIAPIRFLGSAFGLLPWAIRNWKTISRLDEHGVRGMIRRWLR
ncbi:MAG: sulfotransferase [Phycisphaerales bacterium]|nr:sulfotransferase [Phycisphaerales bacterium]